MITGRAKKRIDIRGKEYYHGNSFPSFVMFIEGKRKAASSGKRIRKPR
jgi:hypothetical protein